MVIIVRMDTATHIQILGSLTLIKQPVSEKESFEFKPVKLCLQIDLVLHPTCAERWINTYTFINILVIS